MQACINVIHVSNIITGMLFCSFLDVYDIINMSVKMLKAFFRMLSGLFYKFRMRGTFFVYFIVLPP